MKFSNVSEQHVLIYLLSLLFSFSTEIVKSQDSVKPGEFIIEPATLTCLGFEWYISGDDNRNAIVESEYRISGTREWKQALPLLRIGGENVGREAEHLDYIVPHMFAGSIVDLSPDTEYECRFTMQDNDENFRFVQIVKVKTRREPAPWSGGRILHVYPAKWKGEKKEPSFTTLQGAYYGSGTGDWSVVRERTINPGDIIEIHAGLYEADRFDYVNPEGVPFYGTYFLTVRASEDKPVVIRAAGDGEVIFDGAGAHVLFDVSATEHHIFEGLTIRNADIAFYAGSKNINGAVNLTVRDCRFENVGEGIITEYAGSRNFYIADNVIIGRDDRYRLLGWANPGNIYGVNKMYSYIGIKVCGSGHTICHNAIAFFHDGIAVSTYGTPESQQDFRSVAIDIYNNDLHLMADDFIEADGGVHNIRIMRNLCVNAAQCGLSAQPVFGGPAYFIRNLVYHVPVGIALKFMAKPAGLYVLHNTFIAENANSQIFSNAHFRNNLFMGTGARGRPVAVFPFATSYSTSDFNGYHPNPGENNYRWIAPSVGQLTDYSITLSKDGKSFSDLKSFSESTGLEKNGIETGYDIFNDLQPPDPLKPGLIYHAVDLDFSLKSGSVVVDAGTILPNINDGFSGKAPDLGALESGMAEPVYGPRGNIRNRPFYR
ncbi:MAG: hypothetical protein GYA41_09515 [Bacteroidales bacterium]|nr:hypothetical protein [Bacteroidales bacterium]